MTAEQSERAEQAAEPVPADGNKNADSSPPPEAEESNSGSVPPTKWQKRRARLDAIDAWMKLARSLFTNALLLSVLGLLAFLVGRAVFREALSNSIAIAPLDAPDALVKAGYTPDVLRRRLLDAANEIIDAARTDKHRRGLIPAWPVPDVQVPGAGLSLRSLIQFVIPNKNGVDGEMTMDPDGRVRLQLRHLGKPLAGIHPVQPNAIDDLFREGARVLMAEVDPYVLAAYQYRRHADADALDSISRCLANQRTEDDPWAYTLWGWILIRSEQYENATEKLQQALDSDADFVPAHQAWARALEKQHDYAGAIVHLEKAISLATEDPRLLATRGNIRLQMHEPEQAAKDFERAVEFDPTHLDHAVIASLWGGWGDALLDEGEPDKALRKYEEAMKLNPHAPSGHVGVGFVRLAKRQPDEAIKEFERALDLVSKDQTSSPEVSAEARVGLGRAFLAKRQLDDAQAQLEQALKLSRDAQEAHLTLGDILSAKKEFASAAAEYEQAVKQDPKCGDAWFGWSEALRAMARPTEADDKKKQADTWGRGKTCY